MKEAEDFIIDGIVRLMWRQGLIIDLKGLYKSRCDEECLDWLVEDIKYEWRREDKKDFR